MSRKKTTELELTAKTDKPASDFAQAPASTGDWVEHEDGKVLKLAIGEQIEGLLLSKGTSVKYNSCGIYKIKTTADETPRVILGSKQLDRVMADVNIGDEVRIVFTGTQATTKGNAMKQFKVYTKKGEAQ